MATRSAVASAARTGNGRRDLYQITGGSELTAANGSNMVVTKVGKVNFAFRCNNGSMSYSINGVMKSSHYRAAF
jgi:hypothetical protein